MKIADIELGEKPLLLAPMEDVTDPSFRYMCKRFGPTWSIRNSFRRTG